MPKVSIIMPVYNKARYLTASLKALLSQTFQNWELIIVNDGSTDESTEIIACYASRDHRISVIHQNNQGVSAARNRGMDCAVGEWIWFVDADDLPDKNFLSQVFRMEYDRHIMLIISQYETLENHQINRVILTENGFLSGETFGRIFMKYQYKNGYFGYLWNKLIRRKMIEKSGIHFDDQVKLAEDLKFLVSLYRLDIGVLIVPYQSMCYRVNADNSVSGQRVDYFSQLNIQLTIRKWIIDELHQEQYRVFFQKIISVYAACVIFHGYESGSDCLFLAKKLLKIERVRNELCTQGIEPVLFPIVWCLKRNHLYIMQGYLIIRYHIRSIYRRLKGS